MTRGTEGETKTAIYVSVGKKKEKKKKQTTKREKNNQQERESKRNCEDKIKARQRGQQKPEIKKVDEDMRAREKK